jgi:hypothetical protein
MKMKKNYFVVLVVLVIAAAIAVAYSVSYKPPKVQVPAYQPRQNTRTLQEVQTGEQRISPTMTEEQKKSLPRPTLDPDAPVIRPEDMLSERDKKRIIQSLTSAPTPTPAITYPRE